jgi:hypothetical protein
MLSDSSPFQACPTIFASQSSLAMELSLNSTKAVQFIS